MLSTLQPIIVIIRIFDSSRTVPSHLFEKEQEDQHMYEREVAWLTEAERYSLVMLKDYKHLIALRVFTYPMAYCLATVVITLLLRKHIIDWFELILYIQDEDEPLGSRVGSEERAHAEGRLV